MNVPFPHVPSGKQEAAPKPSPWRRVGDENVTSFVNLRGTNVQNFQIDRLAGLLFPSKQGQRAPMVDLTREEHDAKLATIRAETDTKFTQLVGEIKTSNADIRGEIRNLATHLVAVERSTSGVKATIILAAVGVLAIIVGVLAYGQQYLGLGMTMRDVVRSTVQEMRLEQAPKPQPNNQQ